MSKYKVKLTPLDWFFFGGEQTFDNGDSLSFIAYSNRMPQQTSLLGMVRYQLLKQNNLLQTVNKETGEKQFHKAESLIGGESFNIDAKDAQSFGKIINISPVFIQKGNHQLLPMPLTHGIDVHFEEGKVWLSGKECLKIVKAPNFNEKKYDNFCKLIDEEGTPYKTDGDEGIFGSSMQIGITKVESNEENEKGFFKQETLRFKDSDTSFAFYLELEDGTTLKNDIVFMGAQRTCFKMEVSDCDTLFVPEHPLGSILLLSPAFISDREKLDSNCLMSWCGTIGFRNLRQSENGKLQSGAVSYHRHSSLCTFLTGGSVIFYDNDDRKKELEKLLSKPNLQNIGYNHFDVK